MQRKPPRAFSLKGRLELRQRSLCGQPPSLEQAEVNRASRLREQRGEAVGADDRAAQEP